MELQRCFRLLALVPALLAAMASSAQTLKLGDAAPPIKVESWIQGEPFTTFTPGGVYVVEFWATWCGPCRISIPHLNKLAKQYSGKVRFLGVSVWESVENQAEHVARFVKEMGDQMTYPVAVDGDDKAMATTWMEAAAQDGIPAAFIVQGQKVVWIGHPMEMDQTLADIVLGKFDADAFAKEFAAQAARETASMAKRQRINEAWTLAATGDPGRALKILDEMAKDEDPSISQRASMAKLSVLADSDKKAFEATIAGMAKAGQHGMLAAWANQTASAAGTANAPAVAKARLWAAVSAADLAMKAPKPSPILLYQCGRTYGIAGDKPTASRTLEAALKAFDDDPEYRDNQGLQGLRDAILVLIERYKE